MEMEMEMETEMEVEAGDEPAWKALFQRRVDMADTHCHNLHGLLRGLLVVFDEQEWGAIEAGAEEARGKLESASTELGLAVTNMGAARHLALRCGAPGPGAPLPSVDDLADPDARRALGLLQNASGLASHVHDRVESARGHLGAAALLLVLDEDDGGGDAPWVQPPCKAEQLNAIMDLGEALWQAVDLVFLTAAARDAAFGFVDN